MIANMRPMAKRLTKLIRREQIAAAALDLVAELGTGALTTRNIASAAGLAPSAMYRYFPGGKDEILESVLDLIGNMKTNAIRKAHAESGSAMTKLHGCYEFYIMMVERYRALPDIMLFDTLWNTQDYLRNRLLENYQRHQSEVVEIIRLGQRDGEIRADIDANQIFIQLIGQFLTIASLYSRHKELVDPRKQGEANWKMFLRAVLPL